jgi:hypothetical protein
LTAGTPPPSIARGENNAAISISAVIMPAVWGRLRAVSSTEVLQLPLNKRPRREDAGREAEQGASDKAFWQYTFDSRLNALGITTSKKEAYPYRYEIQKGKTVPRYGDAEEAPQIER